MRIQFRGKNYNYYEIDEKPSAMILIIYLVLLSLSCIGLGLTVFGFTVSSEYSLLFLLPLSYLYLLIIDKDVFMHEANGLGLMVFFAADFIRLVIVPTLVSLGTFDNIISYNAAENTPFAILLMTYEVLWIGIALRVKFKPAEVKITTNIDDSYSNKKMRYLIILVLIVAVVINRLAPEILKSYRKITDIVTQQYATSFEQSKLIDAYGTSFMKKLTLVIANYFFKVVRLLLPMYLLVLIHNKTNGRARLISLLVVLTPFLVIDGGVGTSFHNSFFLLIMFCLLNGYDLKKIYKPLAAIAVGVTAYFIIRSAFSESSMVSYLTESLMAYFSGVNIVAGAFNLPSSITYRAYYFIRDIIGSIPFSTTIFGFDGPTVQAFFNQYNHCSGQIAPTIGLGYYYFSPLFAPLYSVFFIRLCVKNGRKYRLAKNPYYKVIYLFLSYFSALAITAYNIGIILGMFFQILLPIYIIVRIAYRVDKEGNRA